MVGTDHVLVSPLVRLEEPLDAHCARAKAAGAEITCDYNINIANGTAWPCRCGSNRCQGMVVGDFFLLPKERQRAYRPLLAAWFVGRHRERIEALDRDS